jgi:hypothetical protein
MQFGYLWKKSLPGTEPTLDSKAVLTGHAAEEVIQTLSFRPA